MNSARDRNDLGLPRYHPTSYPMPLPLPVEPKTIGGYVQLRFYSHSVTRIQFRSKFLPKAPIVALDRRDWEDMGSPEMISISWGSREYVENRSSA